MLLVSVHFGILLAGKNCIYCFIYIIVDQCPKGSFGLKLGYDGISYVGINYAEINYVGITFY